MGDNVSGDDRREIVGRTPIDLPFVTYYAAKQRGMGEWVSLAFSGCWLIAPAIIMLAGNSNFFSQGSSAPVHLVVNCGVGPTDVVYTAASVPVQHRPVSKVSSELAALLRTSPVAPLSAEVKEAIARHGDRLNACAVDGLL
ncbi:hypothetical protein ACFVTJ_23235 [Agrobacterium sp. NPDC058088]|uniref:hypothetical protein n=1 Tax=Agrobacterium sp. NPDC058088 TaxID=3346335 RepID=UPI0036D89062